MKTTNQYKNKVTEDICPKCKEYGDIFNLLESKSKFGIYQHCDNKECDYKKTIKKFTTYSEYMKKKYPINKEVRKAKLKEMRESKKKVSFEGISIQL